MLWGKAGYVISHSALGKSRLCFPMIWSAVVCRSSFWVSWSCDARYLGGEEFGRVSNERKLRGLFTFAIARCSICRYQLSIASAVEISLDVATASPNKSRIREYLPLRAMMELGITFLEPLPEKLTKKGLQVSRHDASKQDLYRVLRHTSF